MELISAPRYFKYGEMNKGDILIESGVYLESKEGRYGVQHYFEESLTGERKVLNSSGQLNYLVDAHLSEGTKCKIEYDGKHKLTKGAMKGKEAHQFKLYVDRPKAEATTTAQAETNLDDLE